MNRVKVVRHIAFTYVLVRKRTYEADVRINIEVRIRKKTYVGCCYVRFESTCTSSRASHTPFCEGVACEMEWFWQKSELAFSTHTWPNNTPASLTWSGLYEELVILLEAERQ